MRVCVLAGLLLFSVCVPSFAASDAAEAREESRVLIGKDYFPAVHDALSRAERSILVIMYFIIMNKDDAGNPVNVLVDDLIAASRRRVQVRVVLENEKFRENRFAFETLRAAGVEVRYDTPKTFLHTKAVVIDSMTCVLGSANWTKAAFEKNHEVSLIIDSSETARAVEESLAGMVLQGTQPVPIGEDGVLVSEDFLLSPDGGRRLVQDRAHKAFALYLLFLKDSQAAGSRVVQLDYERYGRLLGYRAPPDADADEYYYERLRRPIKRLEKKYKRLKHNARKRTITLPAPASSARFAVPSAFWEKGLADSLFLRAKYAYLISLLEARKSVKNPYWFRSQKDLAKIYGLSEYTISLGLLELERENIVEIIRGERTGEDFGDRLASIYQVNGLVSPGEFEAALGALRSRYGDEITDKARALSGALDEPKDLTKIEIYVHLIGEHGFEAVKKVNDKVAAYKKGSALRDITTTVRLLRR